MTSEQELVNGIPEQYTCPAFGSRRRFGEIIWTRALLDVDQTGLFSKGCWRCPCGYFPGPHYNGPPNKTCLNCKQSLDAPEGEGTPLLIRRDSQGWAMLQVLTPSEVAEIKAWRARAKESTMTKHHTEKEISPQGATSAASDPAPSGAHTTGSPALISSKNIVCRHFQCTGPGQYMATTSVSDPSTCPWCEVERLQTKLDAALRWAKGAEKSEERLRAALQRIVDEYKGYEAWDWYGYCRNALIDPAPYETIKTKEPS